MKPARDLDGSFRPAPPAPLVAAVGAVLRRERLVAAAAVVIVSGLAWAYLVRLAFAMTDAMPPGNAMAEAVAAELHPWTFADAVSMFVMWTVMMVAMMLPSAAPMILLHATIGRQQNAGQSKLAPLSTAAFALGYLLAWTGFSAVATALQWGLEHLALLSPMMASTSTVLGAILLLAAGIYQLTPLKEACLSHCRSPVAFLVQHARPGVRGALAMGLHHGAYCIGCCWFLMLLLFVGGVMNLVWIAGLSILVLLEKVVPRGQWVARLSGALLLLAGTARLAGAWPA